MALRATIERRPVTIALVAFLLLWYGIELAVVRVAGVPVALWWFYWQPFTVSPGIVLSPISHDVHGLGHLAANAAMLIVVGGYAEPHLDRGEFLVILLGLGWLSFGFTNLVAVAVGTPWSLAGLSAGLLALSSYVALRRRHVVFDANVGGLWTVRRWTWILVTTLLLSVPVIPVFELAIDHPTNVGHVMGVVLGCAYYVVDSRVLDAHRSPNG